MVLVFVIMAGPGVAVVGAGAGDDLGSGVVGIGDGLIVSWTGRLLGKRLEPRDRIIAIIGHRAVAAGQLQGAAQIVIGVGGQHSGPAGRSILPDLGHLAGEGGAAMEARQAGQRQNRLAENQLMHLVNCHRDPTLTLIPLYDAGGFNIRVIKGLTAFLWRFSNTNFLSSASAKFLKKST